MHYGDAVDSGAIVGGIGHRECCSVFGELDFRGRKALALAFFPDANLFLSLHDGGEEQE